MTFQHPCTHVNEPLPEIIIEVGINYAFVTLTATTTHTHTHKIL